MERFVASSGGLGYENADMDVDKLYGDGHDKNNSNLDRFDYTNDQRYNPTFSRLRPHSVRHPSKGRYPRQETERQCL